jgi:ribosomal-protein-alanine N-acetyltransferase
VNLRLVTAADIAALIVLERQSATAAHWTEEQYRRALQTGEGGPTRRLALLIEDLPQDLVQTLEAKSPSVLGFLVARHAGAEWELENIVIAPAARRKGLGARLLGELLARASETNSESVFLEVRESNESARALYRQQGFAETGRRKAYYGDPPEDAIVYRFAVSGGTGAL